MPSDLDAQRQEYYDPLTNKTRFGSCDQRQFEGTFDPTHCTEKCANQQGFTTRILNPSLRHTRAYSSHFDMYRHRNPKYAYVEEWRAAVEEEAEVNAPPEVESAAGERPAAGAAMAGEDAPAQLTAVEKGKGRAGTPQTSPAAVPHFTTSFTPVNASRGGELEPPRYDLHASAEASSAGTASRVPRRLPRGLEWVLEPTRAESGEPVTAAGDAGQIAAEPTFG